MIFLYFFLILKIPLSFEVCINFLSPSYFRSQQGTAINGFLLVMRNDTEGYKSD